jgi:hypothetical protein
MLESQSPATYEPPQNLNEPSVETPNSELVVARENSTETVWQAPPEAVPIPAEVVTAETTTAEPVPVRKQEWF